MAAAAVSFEDIKRQIAQRQLSPVYLLHGSEGYFVDELVKDFENILSEDEKVFNQYVLYAPQVQPGEVMDVCSRLPMMSPVQVVILKECQSAKANDLARLVQYVSNPSTSTVFVMCFRGEAAKPKELVDAAKKHGVVYATPEIKDWTVNSYITAYLEQKRLRADGKVVQMLADHIGTSLSRLYNEINKLASILAPGTTVTPEMVEENIGVSKDYNIWELTQALAARDSAKAYKIIDYYTANPKNGPAPVVASALFNFFSNLLVLFFLRQRGESEMRAFMKTGSKSIPKYYQTALAQYNAYQAIEIVTAIRRFDAMSKGIDSRQDPYALLHDLIFHILTARGDIAIH